MNNMHEFPQGLNMEQLMALAGSPQGRAMIAQLQNQNSSQLETAVAQAQAGDFRQVKETLNQYLQSPAGQELMKQLRGQRNG